MEVNVSNISLYTGCDSDLYMGISVSKIIQHVYETTLARIFYSA